MKWTESVSGGCILVGVVVAPFAAHAAPWSQDKAFFTDVANAPSSKVDAADLNGDGYIDLVFANGGGFDKGDANSDMPQQAFFNDAGATMTDVSLAVFGGGLYFNGRAVKLRDVEGDGDVDIVLGTTWASQTQLLLNDGVGNFTNETATHVPQVQASIGDLELGDIDDDGDLDMVLADWGPEAPISLSAGGVTQLWQQMGKPTNFGDPGTGMFEDVTLGQMPSVKVRWSWDAEFVDIDNDYDLDILVSAYAGDTISVFLFTNDGMGSFKDATAGNIAQGKYALDVEPMDLNGDGFLDLLTLHDGLSGRNRVLINNKNGGFTDATELVWPKLENPSSFDFMGAFYDYNSDKAVDIVLGAIQTAVVKYPDRLIVNQAGKFTQWGADQIPKYQALQELKPSSGTYALVLADFNQDNRLDVAMAQSENAFEKKILLGTAEIPVDTAGPIFVNYEKLGPLQFGKSVITRLRCHDNKSPLMLHDLQKEVGQDPSGLPYIESWAEQLPPDPEASPGTRSAPGQWYGEYLWRVQFEVPDADDLFYRICAIDAAGNKACTPIEQTTIAHEPDEEPGTSTTDASTDTGDGMTGVTGMTGTTGTTGTSGEAMTTTMPASTSGDAPTTTGTGSTGDANPTPTESFTTSPGSTGTTGDESTGPGMNDEGEGCSCQGNPGSGLMALGLLPLLFRRRRSRVARTCAGPRGL